MDTNPKAARAAADGKPRLELVETALTHGVAAVAAHGADKYGTRNWRLVPVHIRTYIGAMRRHIDAVADGQWLDPESGLPHLAHVGANLNVVLDAHQFGTLVDDTDFAECSPRGEAANQEGGDKAAGEAIVETATEARVIDMCGLELTDDVIAANPDAIYKNIGAKPDMVGDGRLNGLADTPPRYMRCCLDYNTRESPEDALPEGDASEPITAYCHNRCAFGGPR